MNITLTRIYDEKGSEGYRVLVDRLWPRGISKKTARLDEWLKDAAPSTELRRWYDHRLDRFDEFARRYEVELARSPAAEAVEHILELAEQGDVVLLTATRDLDRSGAQVLLDELNSLHRKE
jgi:uncharacterized protein YeaO (DUF488 family)